MLACLRIQSLLRNYEKHHLKTMTPAKAGVIPEGEDPSVKWSRDRFNGCKGVK
jgi:hypothetical protein